MKNAAFWDVMPCIASNIRVTRINETGTMLAVTNNRSMLCRNTTRTDVSEECIASIIQVTRIGKLGMLAVISN
jgi:hypothetical protein